MHRDSQAQIAELCCRHRIRWLAVYGSVVRDDFRANSDVDILIEFEPAHRYTYFALADIEQALAEILGRRADLHVKGALHPFLRDEVLNEAQALYIAPTTK